LTKETSLYLDVIRFFAALVVFLGHASGKSFTGGLFWQFGLYLDAAVIVFFVLSGYVIGYVTKEKEHTLKAYSISRISRLSSIVFPALLLTIFCDIVGLSLNRDFYVNGPWGYHEGSQVINYLLSSVLLQNVWSMHLNPGINAPFWSLSYEVIYYALFAALFFARGKTKIISIIFLVLLAGPNIVVLFPIWLIGYYSFKVHDRYSVSVSKNWMILISLLFLLFFLFSPLVRASFEYKIQYVSRNLLADYFEAITFSVHICFGLSLFKVLRPILFKFSKVIRNTASLTFALYLFHRPLMQMLVLVSPSEPSSWLTRVIVLGGVIIVVVVLGGWCEKQKYTIKKFLVSKF